MYMGIHSYDISIVEIFWSLLKHGDLNVNKEQLGKK